MPTLTPEQQLRRHLRRQRAALPAPTQQQLATRMVKQLRKQAVFRNARHIALYLPVRGEADPRALRHCALPKQRFYLPVLSPFGENRLWFTQWNRNTRFRTNRFRIPEPLPRAGQQRAAAWLDLVITPLLAFDAQGSRLGMGGGFYDRTFAFKRQQNRPRPYLVGIAYAFQQVPHLTRFAWDIPLDAVVTEAGFFRFRP